jgi:hypothetical protein
MEKKSQKAVGSRASSRFTKKFGQSGKKGAYSRTKEIKLTLSHLKNRDSFFFVEKNASVSCGVLESNV